MIQQSSGNSYLSSDTGTRVSSETQYELLLNFFLEALFVILMCFSCFAVSIPHRWDCFPNFGC